MFKQVYFGLLISSSLLGAVGLVQASHTNGWTQKIAATVGIGGAATALTSLGLGIAYDGKNKALERDYEAQLDDNSRLKDREVNNLKLEINELKSQIKVLETDKTAYAKQISELQQKLNDKAEQYLKMVSDKDLQIKTLQSAVDAKDTRIEDFLEDCRTYTINFFSLRYNNLDAIQKALHKAEVNEETRRNFDKRLADIRELKQELTDSIEEIKRLNITDFKVVLDYIFTFDNKFLNVKTRWKDGMVKEFKSENASLKTSLDNSMPLPVAKERFRAGMDEIDSTIAQERENNGYYYFRDKVTYSLKQASHQNIGAIYIGQACDASTIPGMSWSDWNNAIQLHIGANAGIWLDKAKTITGEDKTKLLEQYRKIQEYCDRKNEELGLDIFTDPGAYRFALAVPLTGLPKFIQLPDFDTYDYWEVINDNALNHSELISSVLQEVTEKASVSNELSSVECPDCGSENIKANGTTQTKKPVQKYLCKDCGKHFTEKHLKSTNSN